MFRLFRAYGNLILLIFTGMRQVREEGGTNSDDHFGLLPYIRSYAQANPDTRLTQYLNNIDWDHTLRKLNGENLTLMIDELLEQLEAGNEDKGDITLIDTIVQLLGLPWSANRISYPTIQALRKSILRPSELEEFKRMSKDAFSCGQCGHVFAQGEAGVVRRDADNNIHVRCIMCAHPTAGICPTCRESAPISTLGLAALTSTKFVQCNCAKDGKKLMKGSAAHEELRRQMEALRRVDIEGPRPRPASSAAQRINSRLLRDAVPVPTRPSLSTIQLNNGSSVSFDSRSTAGGFPQVGTQVGFSPDTLLPMPALPPDDPLFDDDLDEGDDE